TPHKGLRAAGRVADTNPGICSSARARETSKLVDERAHLAQCDQHIVKAKGHIRKQERLIERLEARGYDLHEAHNFLSALIGTLERLEQHRLLILGRLQAER